MDEIEVSGVVFFSAEIGQLVEARAKCIIPRIPKSKTVEVASRRTGGKYKYSYAELSATEEICTPLLAASGLVIFQCPAPARDERQICVMTLLAHTSGQWIRSFTYLTAAGLDAQDSGAAITYARRYGYQAILSISPEDDDDAQPRANGRMQAVASEMSRSKPAAPPKPKDTRPYDERMRGAKSYQELRAIADEMQADQAVQANPDKRADLIDVYKEEKRRLESKQPPPARAQGGS